MQVMGDHLVVSVEASQFICYWHTVISMHVRQYNNGAASMFNSQSPSCINVIAWSECHTYRACPQCTPVIR